MAALRWFIDTAEVSAWREWLPTGLFYGITTNPKLLERAGLPCTLDGLATLAQTAIDLGAQELHMQVWGTSADAMTRTGKQIAALGSGMTVVVKVPITRDGVVCAARLLKAGIPVTMTALYASHQVGTALALGAQYAAPYLGRMDEAGRDGHAAVVAMQQMITRLNSPMRLLVASLRHISDIPALIQVGVDTFTLAPALLPSLFADPLTLDAAADFERAARAMGAES